MYPILQNKDPILVDQGLVYDPKEIEMISHHYQGRAEEKVDGFKFKLIDKKQ
jgi:hypothetical protein